MILCGDLCFEEVEKSFEDLQVKKESVNASIKERHDVLNEAMKSLNNIINNEDIKPLDDIINQQTESSNKEIFDEIDNLLDELLS